MTSSPSFPNFPDKPSPSQLPLPSTLTAIAPNSPSGHGRQASYGTRSNGTSSPLSSPRVEPSRSPTVPTFASQYHYNSTTHAGGIQPSASFFRPSRPNHQYRQPSVESSSALPGDGDVYNLTSLTKRLSSDSDEHTGSIAGGTTEEDHKGSRAVRDPPLTINTRPALSPRPSGNSENAGPAPRSATGRLIRHSLERVFSLRRGMSVESIHQGVGMGSTFEGRLPHDGKARDEDVGMSLYDIPSASPYKTSMAPTDFPSEALHSPLGSPVPSFGFAPRGIHDGPSLEALPDIDPDTKKPFRNYQLHPSRNRFFLNGHVLSGGDSPYAFIGSLTLLFTIGGVWFGTTGPWWWHNLSPAAAIVCGYMTLITISSMLATAFRDPGILPRGLDPDPPYPATSPSDGSRRAPMPRDLKVRSDVVRVKYCPTCKTYRPPRSSHCKMCDNCVDDCDHHCPWVNNCVGRRNYTCFFVLLVSATLTVILVLCTSAIHLYLLTRRNHETFRQALGDHGGKGWGSVIVFILSVAVVWPVSALMLYHVRLLLLNITTIEQIRNQAHKSLVPGPAPPNPFSHGSWRRNLAAVLCRPVGFSWLDFASPATRDGRQVNPGMMQTR